MPWTTPNLGSVRAQNRAYIEARLQQAIPPNGEVRVLADANAGNAHLNLQYLDWQALQYLPDTAEKQFLDKWGTIYLVNADGSRGRKKATYAAGVATVIGTAGTVFPKGSPLTYAGLSYETIAQVVVGPVPVPVPIRTLDAGAAGNQDPGTVLGIAVAVPGVSGTNGATVVSLTGGSDEENDYDLLSRVLQRMRKPPMGGDADDYEAWTLEVAGVTRAWCSPLEMGRGTVTVRFMCDDLRATNQGLPTADDIAAVTAYLDTVRPVAAKDLFVVAPILQPVNFAVTNLQGDSPALRNAIAAGVSVMLKRKAAPAYAVNGVGQPAQTIPAAWVDRAVYDAVGGVSYDLVMTDAVMANAGRMATLGTIS